MNLPRAAWPAKQGPLHVKTGKGLPPVLIVQSTRDAATPDAGAVEPHKLTGKTGRRDVTCAPHATPKP